MVTIALGLLAAAVVTNAIAEYQKAHPAKGVPVASESR